MLNVLVTGSRDQQVLSALRERQLRVETVDLADVVRLTGRAPDAVVIDIRLLGRLPAELALMRRQFPNAGLVILARTLDPGADAPTIQRVQDRECPSDPNCSVRIILDATTAAQD